MTKKYMLLALVSALLIPVGSIAQSTNWGDVAGGDQSGMESNAPKGSADESPWGEVSDVQSGAAVQSKQASKAIPCGEDDPRYSQLMTVLRTVKEGGDVKPLQTSFSTYAGMNAKVRNALGSNVFISSPDCSKQFIFDGDLTGKVTIPFPEQWGFIRDALRVGDDELLGFIIENTSAAPEPAENLISLAQYAPLEGRQLERLNSVMGYEGDSSQENNKIIMLGLYLHLGGTVMEEDRGTMAYLGAIMGGRNAGMKSIYLEKEKGSSKIRIDGKEAPKKVASLLSASGLRVSIMSDGEASREARNND